MDVRRIDVLSDSTGETAEKVVRAAMLQFPHSGAQIRLHTRVRTKEAARPVLERAAREGALVVFTVVSPELREYIHATSYELKPGLKPFIEIDADTRIHDLTFDRNGEQRDSDGVNAKIGTTFEFTRKLTGEIAVGYLTRDYKDPGLTGIGGLTTDASLIFAATALTTFTATAKSTVNEVVLPGVSGDFSRDYALQIDHSFRLWLIGTAQIGYGTDDYVGLDRFDQRWFASFALIYKLSRDVQLKAQIRRDWIASDLPGIDYVADQFLLGIRDAAECRAEGQY